VKEFFNINKRQERGIFVLSLIIMIMIIIDYFAPDLAPDLPAHITDNAKYLNQVKLLKVEEEPTDPKVCFEIRQKEKGNRAVENLHLKVFDPNVISEKEMLAMGFTKFLAANIRKYREKGGRFKKKKDLAKIYGMEDAFYSQLISYIDISVVKEVTAAADETFIEKVQDWEVKEKPHKKVHLGINSADSVQLLEVEGIGPYYAGAIIRYRNRLGGFVNKLQLLELYNVDSVKYHRWEDQLYLDTLKIRKLPINTADFKTILRHPYIDYETTKYIVNKRAHLVKFAALSELKDPRKLPNILYQKLLPYLSLE
jgi:DNA uptake protein ComE-like DNA-binding protein